MANNENFIDHINVAYNEYEKYAIFNEDDDINKVSHKMITGYTVFFVLISFIFTILESFSLLLSFVLVSSAIPWLSLFTYKFFSKKRSQLKKIGYLGKVSDIFDINHPVILENKDKILNHLEENKFISGDFAFYIYCKIQEYDVIKQEKFTINNITYDKNHVNNVFEENKKELGEIK